MKLKIDDVWLKIPDVALPVELSWAQAQQYKNNTSMPQLRQVYGVLHNDARGLAALGDTVNQAPYKAAPQAVVLYNKPRNTFRAHQQSLIVPKNIDALQIGAALGIVIGDTATRLTLDNALSAVAGYTVVADASVPHEIFYRPSMRFKAFDASCAIGPWVRGATQISNPDALILRTYVNNELVQEYSTAIFTRSVAQLLVDVTEFMTLQQGDILMLGVAHPTALAKLGDIVTIEIENVGVLTNTLEGAL